MKKCDVCGEFVKGEIYNIGCRWDNEYTVWYDDNYDQSYHIPLFLVCSNHNYENIECIPIKISDHMPEEQHFKYLKQLIIKND